MSTTWTGSPVFCYSCAFGYMATRDVITRSEGLPLPGRGSEDKVGQDTMPPYLHRYLSFFHTEIQELEVLGHLSLVSGHLIMFAEQLKI